MKYRTMFVSNSSSASFVLDKEYLTARQQSAIINYYDTWRKLNSEEANSPEHARGLYDSWEIDETDDLISGKTYMDNLSMSQLFERLKIPEAAIINYDGDY